MPRTELRSKWVRGFLNFYRGGANARMRVGETADFTYGGDVSSDSAGDGIRVEGADGFKHFAYDVYADDGGTALTAGWVSSGFFSMKNYAAVTGGINLSTFGLTGQFHAGASISSIGNICGIFGVAETVTGVTLSCNFFGAVLGATIPSGATLSANYYAGGLIIGGNYAGTTTGNIVAIFLQNPTSTANFDYAFAFGQNAEYAGVVTVAAVGGSNTHKLKVIAGGTDFFIPMYTS